MLSKRITEFSSALSAAKENPTVLCFRRIGIYAGTNESVYKYLIAEKKIFYSSHLKYFQDAVIGYLEGTFSCEIEMHDQECDTSDLHLDAHVFISKVVEKISSETIHRLFHDRSSIVVIRSSHHRSAEEELSKNLLDHLLLFYHQYLPKPIDNFFADFPATEQTDVLRALLRLSLFGSLIIQDQKPVSPAQSVFTAPVDKHESNNIITFPSPAEITAHAETNSRVGGLRKILSAINKL